MTPENFLKEIGNLYSKTPKKTNNVRVVVLSGRAAQVVV
jgi:hypothetical protein